MTVSAQRKSVLLTLLVLTTALMTMSNDLYAPSIPNLPEYFDTDQEMVKLTISLWSMAYGGLLFIYGPLSERFGRRPILVGAMAIFTVATFYCSVATTIQEMIIARVLQGAAAGAEGVLVLSIIRDSFNDKGQVKAFSIYRGVSAVPPIVAPIVGVYVYLAFGWQANFVLLAVIAFVVTTLLWFYLEESGGARRSATNLRATLSSYVGLVSSIRFVSLALIMSSSIAFLVVFSTAVPFVLNKVLGLRLEVFAYFQAVVMGALIIGNIVANRLVRVMQIQSLLAIGISTALIGCLLLITFVYIGELNLYTLGVAMVVIAVGNAPVLATVPTLAMNATRSSTGTAAAMLLTFTSLLGSTTAIVEGRINDGTIRSLVIILVGATTIALLSYGIGVKLTKPARAEMDGE